MASRPDSMASESLATALNTPLPIPRDSFLDPPRASYLASDATASPRDSYAHSTPGASETLLPPIDKTEPDAYAEEHAQREAPGKKSRRPLIIAFIGLAVLAIIVLAVILPVYFTVIKPNRNNTDAATSNSGGSAGSPATPSSTSTPGKPSTPQGAITGGDGSTVTMEDGSTFVYKNQFGGFWVSDPNDAFNNNAQPNSWTPPLNQSWTWGKDRVNGVNLGGLFVLEPFISPALFQKYPGAQDEWDISTMMAADTANGGLKQLEDHYNTFITEQDIAEIAGAGLNWVRVPVPYWAIETWPGEPFLAQTSWKYILRLIGWCRKYGLRVNLDLHTAPGSQNGYNHSGKLGQVNVLNGAMGLANAQRLLNYIRVFTEFISQDEYKDVIPMFGIINEMLYSTIGSGPMTSFYIEAHNMIRDITGYGEGKGPYISIHDGFQGLSSWAGFLPGTDRMILDTHPYFAFSGSGNTSPINTGTGINAGGIWPRQACNSWGPGMNNSRRSFGVTVAGEFSNGYNDCGLFLNGVSDTHSFGDCTLWQDSSLWDAPTIAGVKMFAYASMDALQDYFFWTWKIGNSTAGRVESPLWSYKHGLDGGWMPKDPREVSGTCEALGVSGSDFSGTFQPWQTGGAGAGTIAPTATAGFPWPPAQISNADNVAASLMPVYTPTGTLTTLPGPTATESGKVVTLSGWVDKDDTSLAPTSVAGCTYPDPWDSEDASVPPVCASASGAFAAITPAPPVGGSQ